MGRSALSTAAIASATAIAEGELRGKSQIKRFLLIAKRLFRSSPNAIARTARVVLMVISADLIALGAPAMKAPIANVEKIASADDKR